MVPVGDGSIAGFNRDHRARGNRVAIRPSSDQWVGPGRRRRWFVDSVAASYGWSSHILRIVAADVEILCNGSVELAEEKESARQRIVAGC